MSNVLREHDVASAVDLSVNFSLAQPVLALET